MRKVMRGKRRKSESASDAESNENGGNAHKSDDVEQTKPDDDNNDDDESAPKSKRRAIRGRDNIKSTATDDMSINKDDNNEIGNESSKLSNHENGSNNITSIIIDKNIDDKRSRKKDEAEATTSQGEMDESEDEYEVERIISQRTIKGRRQFLIRWKGYEDDADTWKDESELNCSQLIDDFLIDKEIEEENENEQKTRAEQNLKQGNSSDDINNKHKTIQKNKRPKAIKRTRRSTKTTKKQKNGEKVEHNEVVENNGKQGGNSRKKTRKLKGKKYKNEDENNDDGEEKEFEVERILDVYFKKNKTREFLIRWKGFRPSDDTWEPEANLNCPELIIKFMEKVEKAKTQDSRELRTNPSHTKRYTLTMQSAGRRLSRRNAGKERTTYHECDD